jgi:hypothetical protein
MWNQNAKVFTTTQTPALFAINVASVQFSPAHEEASAQFGRMSAQILSRSESKEIKHAWNNRCGSDCSLVAWVFRIPCNRWFHSRGPSCGPDITCAAFRDRQNSKRVER